MSNVYGSPVQRMIWSMRIGRIIRRMLLTFGLVVIALLVAWRLPGCEIHPQALDYVRAFDDPPTRSVIVVAAFDGWSFGVIDSCTYQWSGGDLLLEMRQKWFVARDGRSSRIGAFRVPYPPAATGAGAVATPSFTPTSVTVRASGGADRKQGEIQRMPAAFNPLTPIVDAEMRE